MTWGPNSIKEEKSIKCIALCLEWHLIPSEENLSSNSSRTLSYQPSDPSIAIYSPWTSVSPSIRCAAIWSPRHNNEEAEDTIAQEVSDTPKVTAREWQRKGYNPGFRSVSTVLCPLHRESRHSYDTGFLGKLREELSGYGNANCPNLLGMESMTQY